MDEILGLVVGSGEGSLVSTGPADAGRRDDEVATDRLLLALCGYPLLDAESFIMALGAEISEPNDWRETLPFASSPNASTSRSMGLN